MNGQRVATKGREQAPERCRGGYAGSQWDVLDSTAYIGLRPAAKALLMELQRQHSGRNNGHLHLAETWLARRGWKSSRMIRELRDELLARNLIICTRAGGRNFGPRLFALTWLPISDFVGLEIAPADYQIDAWARFDPATMPPKRKSNRWRSGHTPIRSENRIAAPPGGGRLRPQVAAKSAELRPQVAASGDFTAPPGGAYVMDPLERVPNREVS